jgi:hypothetical protein
LHATLLVVAGHIRFLASSDSTVQLEEARAQGAARGHEAHDSIASFVWLCGLLFRCLFSVLCVECNMLWSAVVLVVSMVWAVPTTVAARIVEVEGSSHTSEANVCSAVSNGTAFWAVSQSGFLSARNDLNTYCSSPLIASLCSAMLGDNPTTENIALSLEGLYSVMKNVPTNYFDNYATEAEDIENIYHWLGMAACRVGYNQNHAGDKTGTPIVIPKQLAVPLLEYSRFLRREPFVSYSAMVLDNCVENTAEVDPAVPAYTDWTITRTVTSGAAKEAAANRAEKGFYATHCAVEKHFGATLLTLQALKNHGPCESMEQCGEMLIKMLRKMAFNIRNAASYLRHMRHFYNPSHFYSELRPFIKCGNVAENGMIFELDGHSDYDILLNNGTVRRIVDGQVEYEIRGPSGAGTTSLPSIDAGLQIIAGIKGNPPLERAMSEFRQFHPHDHFVFNDELRTIHFRDNVIRLNDSVLTDAYNDAVVGLAQFRDAHVEHIETYIVKAIKHVPPQHIMGTGNTPVVKYLCEAFFGTLRSLIREGASPNLPAVSIDSICFAECITGQYQIHNKEYCDLYNSTMALLD